MRLDRAPARAHDNPEESSQHILRRGCRNAKAAAHRNPTTPSPPPAQPFQGFMEIHSPKLLAGASEGGSEVFMTNYFGKPACLAQSPQLYKQMAAACGGFGRVMEVRSGRCMLQAELSRRSNREYMVEWLSWSRPRLIIITKNMHIFSLPRPLLTPDPPSHANINISPCMNTS